jgi:hypothetical protein
VEAYIPVSWKDEGIQKINKKLPTRTQAQPNFMVMRFSNLIKKILHERTSMQAVGILLAYFKTGAIYSEYTTLEKLEETFVMKKEPNNNKKLHMK